jgi:hypothetical protein
MAHASLSGVGLMSKVGPAIEKGETQGFMKVLVDAETRKILGGNILALVATSAAGCPSPHRLKAHSGDADRDVSTARCGITHNGL